MNTTMEKMMKMTPEEQEKFLWEVCVPVWRKEETDANK